MRNQAVKAGHFSSSRSLTSQSGNFSAKTVWRYTQGNACGNALNFGTLASGTTYSHTNSNRAAPSGAGTDMGYTNAAGNSSPDVYYQFTISSQSTVVISTVDAGTNYDTYLTLYNSGCSAEITSNDDFSGTQSQISTTLNAGTYIILVEGYNANAGDFVLKVTATTSVPVELLYFSGIQEGNINRMNWSTASEKNTAYFEVERSKDGFQFTSVGRIAAAGNSTSTLAYSFNDMSPLSDVSYYRLRMVDLDGSHTYSQVISLERSVKGVDLANLYLSCPSNTGAKNK